jgi:Tfp pilus assembly protein PilN
MINLLPPEQKQQISYARKNSQLLNWMIALTVLIIAIFTLTLVGQFFISQNINSLKAINQSVEQRIEQRGLANTQKEVESLSNNMTTVVKILKDHLLFSKIFDKIGSLLPPGTSLSGIEISSSESALELEFKSSTQDAASQVFINISDPNNGLFEKADLLNVNCPRSDISRTDPCITQVRVIIKTDSNFYFLNSIEDSQ